MRSPCSGIGESQPALCSLVSVTAHALMANSQGAFKSHSDKMHAEDDRLGHWKPHEELFLLFQSSHFKNVCFTRLILDSLILSKADVFLTCSNLAVCISTVADPTAPNERNFACA